MAYSVLAFDLDGTLTDSAKRVGKRTVVAIRKAIGSGCDVVLASGRPLLGIMPVAQRLGLPELGGYIVGFNGALVTECRTGSIVYERSLGREAMLIACRFAREKQLACLGYDAKGIVTEMPDDPYVARESYNNAIPVRKTNDLPGELGDAQPKIMIVGDPDKLVSSVPELKRLLADRAAVGFSDPYFVEITYPGVQKASSLDVLLHRLGKDRRALMAVGDALNDIPMLDIAGLAVAMENALPEVKDHADFVTASNDDEGVALAVERFVLSPS